jgi:hypothetical protein
MPSIVLYDLDSTISNTLHREHLAPAENREALESWIEYSKACINDPVIEGVAASARLYQRLGAAVGFVSGRNEEARDETIAWLERHSIHPDLLKLHDENDPRHNGEHKAKFVKELQAKGWTVELFFEDHISVCEYIEAETSVPCVTVRPRYEDNVGVSFNLVNGKEAVTA